MVNTITGLHLNDTTGGMRAFKKKVTELVPLYGEMHRFIPAILSTKGYKIGEVVTKHQHRKYGKTNYNSTRILKGLLCKNRLKGFRLKAEGE